MQGAGIYLTRQRRAIIAAVSRRLHAFGVADLCAEAGLRRVSMICIYRNLLKFESIGLLKRSFTRRGGFLFQIQPAGSSDSITLTCHQCGDQESIPDAGISLIQRELANRGYLSVGHLAEFVGVCPDCARATAQLAPLSVGIRPAQTMAT
jgi:Fe2+ or Zn2+ uptake regulation protein